MSAMATYTIKRDQKHGCVAGKAKHNSFASNENSV